MQRTWWAAFLTVVVLALGGCGRSAIDSNITVFHSLPPSVSGKTVAVVAVPEELNDSLEFKAFRPVVERYLIEAGFEIVSRDNADYIAQFSFGFDRGSPGQVASLAIGNNAGDPLGYGHTERPAEHRFGVSEPGAGQSVFSISKLETVDHPRSSRRDGVYARNVAIDLVAASAPESGNGGKIYKARAVSVGSCVGKPEVVHMMVAAIFDGFPGRSGATRVIRLPMRADCRSGSF